MRILYALLCYPPSTGGGEIHTHCIARHMRSLGHVVQTVCQWNGFRRDFLLGTTLRCGQPYNYDYDAIPVARLGFSAYTRGRMLPWVAAFRIANSRGWTFPTRRIACLMAPQFAETVDRIGVDLIHSVRIGHAFLIQTAFDYARQRDRPFIITPLYHPDRLGLQYLDEERLFRSADAVIALTEYERRALAAKGVPEDRIHVTGCGPILATHSSPERFRSRYNLDGPFVLFLGRHVLHKGYVALLKAAPLAWRRYPALEFVFIGTGDERVEKIFREFADPRIRRLGTVDLQTKTDALAACQMLCVPSDQESFGGVYTEAWSFSKPVIGGRSPAIAHVIEENVTGLISSQEPAELANKICSLMEAENAARDMGVAGQEMVVQHYDWRRLAEKTQRIYDSVTGGSSEVATV